MDGDHGGLNGNLSYGETRMPRQLIILRLLRLAPCIGTASPLLDEVNRHLYPDGSVNDGHDEDEARALSSHDASQPKGHQPFRLAHYPYAGSEEDKHDCKAQDGCYQQDFRIGYGTASSATGVRSA